MTDAGQVLTSRMRLRAMLAIAAMAVVGVLILGSQAPSVHAENKCTSGELCAWTGTFYSGSEYFLSCASSTFPINIPEAKSAKNRCSTSQEIGWGEGGSINWKYCMAPGGERPEPGRFNEYRKC